MSSESVKIVLPCKNIIQLKRLFCLKELIVNWFITINLLLWDESLCYPRSQKRQERYISLESSIKEQIPKAKGLQAN